MSIVLSKNWKKSYQKNCAKFEIVVSRTLSTGFPIAHTMGDSLEATVGSMGSDPPQSVVGGGVDTESVAIMDYDGFTNYIRKAVTILLPEEDVVPVPLNAALDDPSNQECIRKFLSDPQTQALYIQRSCFKGKRSFSLFFFDVARWRSVNGELRCCYFCWFLLWACCV